jgi:hypothetical protein
MKLRRILSLGALASCFLLASSTNSQAAYSYSTAITILSYSGISGSFTNTPGTGAVFTTSNSGSGATTLTFSNTTQSGINGTFGGPIGGTSLVTTNTGAPQTFTLFYQDVVTVTNGGPTGSFTISGTLSLFGINTVGGGGGSNGTTTNFFGPLSLQQQQTIGTNTFFVNFGDGTANNNFTQPGPNGGSGLMSFSITTIPEPASLALVGIGLLGVLGVSLRHRKKT